MAPDAQRPPDGNGNPPSGGQRTTLMALGTAMVLSIYSAGFMRTRDAATRIAADSDLRRAPLPDVRQRATDTRALSVAPVAAAERTIARDTSALSVASARTTEIIHTPVRRSLVGGATTPVADSAPVRAPVVTASSMPDPALPTVNTTPVDTVVKTPGDTARAGYRDGTYSGWGTSRHGDIEATVEIRGGRIISADISQCRTRYSCSRISELPPQVLARQTPEVDHVSGATQSSDAYYYAVAEALKKAK